MGRGGAGGLENYWFYFRSKVLFAKSKQATNRRFFKRVRPKFTVYFSFIETPTPQIIISLTSPRTSAELETRNLPAASPLPSLKTMRNLCVIALLGIVRPGWRHKPPDRYGLWVCWTPRERRRERGGGLTPRKFPRAEALHLLHLAVRCGDFVFLLVWCQSWNK